MLAPGNLAAIGSLVYRSSRALNWFGGLVLIAIALMSVASILGRVLSGLGLGLGPMTGDFELVEAGMALAAFCFLPWAHLKRSHAMVDLFWAAFPITMQRALTVLTDALMLFVWLLLVWRMGLAMLEYRVNGEVSAILQIPMWWNYAASFVPAVFGCFVYAWRLLEDLNLVPQAMEKTTGAGAH